MKRWSGGVARWKRWLREAVVTLLIAAVLLTVVGYVRAPSFEEGFVPDVNTTTIDGSIADTFRNTEAPVLLHFWAVWCPTCRAEAGNISAVAQDLPVVTVAVKSGSDAEIRHYLQRNDLTFATVNDADARIARRFGITVFPTTLIIHRGRAVWSETGFTTGWGLRLRMWLVSQLG